MTEKDTGHWAFLSTIDVESSENMCFWEESFYVEMKQQDLAKFRQTQWFQWSGRRRVHREGSAAHTVPKIHCLDCCLGAWRQDKKVCFLSVLPLNFLLLYIRTWYLIGTEWKFCNKTQHAVYLLAFIKTSYFYVNVCPSAQTVPYPLSTKLRFLPLKQGQALRCLLSPWNMCNYVSRSQRATPVHS